MGVPMKETEIIESLRTENDEFRKLEEDHKKLERILDELLRKKYLTPEEDVEKKKIQKQKLHCKDRMAELIRSHK